MRIISGKFKGRRLYSPQDGSTRPTSDRVRESVFNILENSFCLKWEGSHVLDLYAGTGALGVESLSRGAFFCLFVDHHSKAIDVIKKNASSFPHVSFWKEDGSHLKLNPYQPFDVIFLDPPYNENLIPVTLKNLLLSGYIKNHTYIIVEVSAKEKIQEIENLKNIKEKIYGHTKIIFLHYKDLL